MRRFSRFWLGLPSSRLFELDMLLLGIRIGRGTRKYARWELGEIGKRVGGCSGISYVAKKRPSTVTHDSLLSKDGFSLLEDVKPAQFGLGHYLCLISVGQMVNSCCYFSCS